MTARCRRRGGRPRAARPGQQGFAFIALLIGIAIIGVAAAATLQLGGLYQRRMAEKELLYIGGQFQRALLSYADNTPVGLPTQPRTLDDLVRDPRYPNPMRHLRRVYADPLTGKADWVLVRAPDGQGIVGIHSASREHPIQLRQFPQEFRGFEDRHSYAQWVFVARSPRLAPGQLPPNAAGGMPSPAGGVFLPGVPASAPVAVSDAGWPSGNGDSTGTETPTGGGFLDNGGANDDGFFQDDGGFSGKGMTNGTAQK